MDSSADTASKSSGQVESVDKDIETALHIEVVKTRGQVPGHSNYYEKNGLQTTGDDEDHNHEPPMTFSRLMSLISMAILFSGSHIPVILLGPVQAYIFRDIGGSDHSVWYILGNLVTLAAICPFVGSLSDLLGRRWVALLGAGLLVLGMIVATTATTMDIFIGGMVISGSGAGVNELIAIAVTTEVAPTAKRGKYVAVLIGTLVPYMPSMFWGQLVASKSPRAWRYLGLWAGLWAFLGMVLTFFFYHPAPRTNSLGLSRREIIAQIDWLGGLLSVGGSVLFIMGMVWGGYQYAWSSAHVLVTLIPGAVMLVVFGAWETYGAKFPMFPRRLRSVPRTMALTLLITFISGANFFAVLIFWPSESYNVYGHDPIANGWRGLPVAFSIVVGGGIVLVLLSFLRGYNRALMIGSTCLMTGGTAAFAVLNRDNVQLTYVLLVIAGLGIGGIIVPASVMTTIICPDDLIATMAALTLSIRVLGGAIGYTTYYNVLYSKVRPILAAAMVGACIEAEVFNATTVEEIGNLLVLSLNEEVLPLVGGNQTKFDIVVRAAQVAFSQAYKWVYYVSIPFGVIAIIAAYFLEDMSPYMDNHVAVVYS